MALHAQHRYRRRGAVVALTVTSMLFLLGFAALALDVGLLSVTKGELQNAADAAALAGASAHGSEAMRQVRLGTMDASYFSDASLRARQIAQRTGLLNENLGQATFVEPKDVSMGWLDLNDDDTGFLVGVPPQRYNAVQVVTRRSKASTNGAVRLLFAPVMGWQTAELDATAAAVFEQGYPDIAPLPFSVDRVLWDTEIAAGVDDYRYDTATNTTINSGDGIPEVVLFPTTYAAGNFGALAIGPSPGAAELGVQIRDGISSTKLNHTLGEDYPDFRDDYDDPKSYIVSGNTGIKASIEPDLEGRLGQVVGIFVHTGAVLGGGATSTYDLIEIRYVEIVRVDLTSANVGIWVQPAAGYDNGLGTPGRLRLAR
jgi:hypothetical protein